MKPLSILRRISQCLWPVVVLLGATQHATSQTPAPPPAWSHAQYFKYNIENVLVNTTTAAGTWNVKVIFSITDPTNGAVWNIKSDLPYQSAGAGLTIDIGWDPSTDFTNTGSVSPLLGSVVTNTLGTGAAMPIQIRNLNNPTAGAKPCTPLDCPGIAATYNRFWVEKLVTPMQFMQTVAKGRIGMEGHPVCSGLPGCPTSNAPYANIPVRSETVDFAYLNVSIPTTAIVPDQRRQVVDFGSKCSTCHNGIKLSGSGTPIPRLSLHGNNRNENLNLCVMCHNPNQTDVPYRVLTSDARTSGPETSIDFKRMVHSIHAGGFKQTPYVVVGFNSSINDFSDVRFPGELRNCLNCHIDKGGKGTFELPLNAAVLGSTVTTGSTYAVPAGSNRTIDVNPLNDLKIAPTAATCSGCHDKSEVRFHMIKTGGASFGTLQQYIGTTVKERCASCHGPGKEEDVRKAHEIRSSVLSGNGEH
jgi:OmcA/MtrC family decaheme c-type cytochrome